MQDYPLPKIIGHRGACGYAPENTLASFRKAYELGVKWVEFDVVLSKDSVPIVFHDATTTRTTNLSNRNIADLTLSEIQQLDAGSWFAAEFYEERIPTLAQVLEFLRAHDMQANIELKPTPGLEAQTTRTALAVIETYYAESNELPLISSFATECLSTMRYAHSTMPLALLRKEWENQDVILLTSFACKSINLDCRYLNEDIVKTIKNLGYAIISYTVNDVKEAKKLFTWGVNGIFTNYPDQFL
jgi:glycerophosphoryl diester phosphodiesterase